MGDQQGIDPLIPQTGRKLHTYLFNLPIRTRTTTAEQTGSVTAASTSQPLHFIFSQPINSARCNPEFTDSISRFQIIRQANRNDYQMLIPQSI